MPFFSNSWFILGRLVQLVTQKWNTRENADPVATGVVVVVAAAGSATLVDDRDISPGIVGVEAVAVDEAVEVTGK